ncbi:MAG: hypothetical protein RL596_1711 [Bacteroidota bacterium]|jgi:hypothetical protein
MAYFYIFSRLLSLPKGYNNDIKKYNGELIYKERYFGVKTFKDGFIYYYCLLSSSDNRNYDYLHVKRSIVDGDNTVYHLGNTNKEDYAKLEKALRYSSSKKKCLQLKYCYLLSPEFIPKINDLLQRIAPCYCSFDDEYLDIPFGINALEAKEGPILLHDRLAMIPKEWYKFMYSYWQNPLVKS